MTPIRWCFLLLLAGYAAAQGASSALEELYMATQGDTWLNHTNWLTGDPCGDAGWFGLVCLENSSIIIYIDLSANNLTGTLPDSLNELTALQGLTLGYNQNLQGTIPPLTNLTNLEVLYLNDTGLEGSFPEWLPELPNLNLVSLSNTSLSGEFPEIWCTMSGLEQLRLGGQELTGQLPDCIENMASLISLEIFATLLNGSLPSSITRMKNLQYLELYYNQLTGTIPEDIGNLVNLQRLLLYENQLEGTLPISMGNLNSVVEVHLRNNFLEGTIPPSFQGMGRLATLGLSSNYFNGTIPEWLSPNDMVDLQNLDLRCNEFIGPLPHWLEDDPSNEFDVDVYFGCNNITSTELPDWCLKQLRCGPNACEGSRCLMPPVEGPNRIVFIFMCAFLGLLAMGNAVLAGVLIRKKCCQKPAPAELKPLIR